MREWSEIMQPIVDSAPALFGSAVYVVQAEDTGVIMQIIRKFNFNAQPDLNFGVGRF